MTEFRRRLEGLLFWGVVIGVVLAYYLPPADPALAQETGRQHLVQPGDTWTALAWRYGLAPAALQEANPHFNQQRQPAIGKVVRIPAAAAEGDAETETGPEPEERFGAIVRSSDGGLLPTAVRYNVSPWQLATVNQMTSPHRPLLYRPLFVPGGQAPPRELPPGFASLELAPVPARPGEALGFRGLLRPDNSATTGQHAYTGFLNNLPAAVFVEGENVVGLVGTGAFYPAGEHELAIVADGQPLWSQPWLMEEGEWVFQQITLTGAAAAIDAESIARERERLFAIWSQESPVPQWEAAFQLPIRNYLAISSDYGARRSYNGGPYRSYHEGVDFSAYGGTPVYAPAAGTVVLAEFLYVRGGAVIIDHGLGIYTGYYHMSEVAVEPGQVVTPGEVVGAVGTTGLSTGNHLHWDLLVGATWVDAAAWLERDMACWVLEGLGKPCGPANDR